MMLYHLISHVIWAAIFFAAALCLARTKSLFGAIGGCIAFILGFYEIASAAFVPLFNPRFWGLIIIVGGLFAAVKFLKAKTAQH